MRYLIFLGHPAHFHLFKNIIPKLEGDGHQVKLLIRNKDILEELCSASGFAYQNVLPEQRGNSLGSLILSYGRKYWRISKIIRNFKPTLLLGSEPSLTHLGKIFSIPSFVFSEDDASIIPQFAKIAYPFVDVIMSPNTCNAGKWEVKKIGYDGFHKLAYLHPSVFLPEEETVGSLASEAFFILRFANLVAYHDTEKTGITNAIAQRLIDTLIPYGKVLITSERPLPPQFEPYRIDIDPTYIHHFLAYAQMYIGDSQSMAVEAALLGTPGIRFNDFAGEIGVLNDLEYKYGLTNSFKTSDEDGFFSAVENMLNNKNLRKEYQSRRLEMLKDKINVLRFFVWFIENYPESREIMRQNPDYHHNFY